MSKELGGAGHRPRASSTHPPKLGSDALFGQLLPLSPTIHYSKYEPNGSHVDAKTLFHVV